VGGVHERGERLTSLPWGDTSGRASEENRHSKDGEAVHAVEGGCEAGGREGETIERRKERRRLRKANTSLEIEIPPSHSVVLMGHCLSDPRSAPDVLDSSRLPVSHCNGIVPCVRLLRPIV
jgi:hypothetical protein